MLAPHPVRIRYAWTAQSLGARPWLGLPFDPRRNIVLLADDDGSAWLWPAARSIRWRVR